MHSQVIIINCKIMLILCEFLQFTHLTSWRCAKSREDLWCPTHTVVLGTSTAPWSQTPYRWPILTASSENALIRNCFLQLLFSARTSMMSNVKEDSNRNHHVSFNLILLSFLLHPLFCTSILKKKQTLAWLIKNRFKKTTPH